MGLLDPSFFPHCRQRSRSSLHLPFLTEKRKEKTKHQPSSTSFEVSNFNKKLQTSPVHGKKKKKLKENLHRSLHHPLNKQTPAKQQ